jgi:Homing endonuclease associated repeat
VRALKRDAKRRKRPPSADEWARAKKARPCALTVADRFGSWSAALKRAGLEPKGVGGGDHGEPWTPETIVAVIRDWRQEHGRWARLSDVETVRARPPMHEHSRRSVRRLEQGSCTCEGTANMNHRRRARLYGVESWSLTLAKAAAPG